MHGLKNECYNISKGRKNQQKNNKCSKLILLIYVKCKLLTEQYVFEVYQCMALISFDKQYICCKAI